MIIPKVLLQWLALAAVVVYSEGALSKKEQVEALRAYYAERPIAGNGVEGEQSDSARSLDVASMIYPGTKYCGPGNISDAEIPPEQYLAAEDACCQAHDECTPYIRPGQTEPTSGLTNKCPLLKLECQCDDDLFKCLKNVGSEDANVIGSIYFNRVTRNCFKYDYPVKCRYNILFIWTILRPTSCRSCFSYCTDTSAPMEWHWRPTALYETSDTALTYPPPC